MKFFPLPLRILFIYLPLCASIIIKYLGYKREIDTNFISWKVAATNMVIFSEKTVSTHFSPIITQDVIIE